jgi:nucleoside-diphosphate-sugar epimerase
LGIEPIVADVLEPGSLCDLPATECVFYCVGFDRSAVASMRSVYVDGLQNVLDRLPRSVRRFVYASTTGVYGQTGGEWVDEESPAFPRHESGKVCLEAEERVRSWALARKGSGSSAAVVLRFAGLYGPGRAVRRSVLERGEPITGDADKFLNLIHIDDAAEAAVAALQAILPEPLYLIGDDRPVTRGEYYTLMATLLGAPEPRFNPTQPGTVEEARDATNKRVANERMKRGLGIALHYPDISVGLPPALGAGREC